MKPLLLFVFIPVVHATLFAQEEPTTPLKKTVPGSATLKLSDGSIAKGWLYKLNDSQVVLLHVPGKKLKRIKEGSPENWNKLTATISIDQIRAVSVRKKNAVVKGMLIGLGTGILTGAIIGYASGDDKIQSYPDPATDPFGLGAAFTAFGNAFAMTAGEKASAYGVGLGIAGTLTGVLIGALAKKKFIIGGKKEKYHDMKAALMRRLIVQ